MKRAIKARTSGTRDHAAEERDRRRAVAVAHRMLGPVEEAQRLFGASVRLNASEQSKAELVDAARRFALALSLAGNGVLRRYSWIGFERHAKVPDELRAFHEAGHFVLDEVFGFGAPSTSIEARPDRPWAHGSTAVGPELAMFFKGHRPSAKGLPSEFDTASGFIWERAAQAIETLQAGYWATLYARPGELPLPDHYESDFVKAKAVAAPYWDASVVEMAVGGVHARTEVRVRRLWPAIEGVARALLLRKTLTARRAWRP